MNGNTVGSSSVLGRSLDDNENMDADDDDSILNKVQMDIGAPGNIHVTMDMLLHTGVNIVKPILQEFVTEAGPTLAHQCIVKLTN